MQTVQMVSNGGELFDVELKKRNYLHKADRMIDHSTIKVLQNLKPAELKVLMEMWFKCDLSNFFRETIEIPDLSYKSRLTAIKQLIQKDLIKTAHLLTGKKTYYKGFIINPFYFRKSKSNDDYHEMLFNYNLDKENILITKVAKDLIQEQETSLKQEIKEIGIING